MPRTIASENVDRKLVVSCCDVATGTTINALTSSSPTVRMATATVTAASTAIITLSTRTGRPVTLANSSSWHTANNCGANPVASTSTTSARIATTQRSVPDTVTIEPKRYEFNVAAVLPASPVIRTPKAIPP